MGAPTDTINIADYQRRDAAHFLHPFTDSALLSKAGTRLIESAKGVYLYTAQGEKILDGMSGLWCVNLGYGRDELVDAAAQQLKKLPYYNSFFNCTTPVAIDLSTKLAQFAPEGMNTIFYGNSGSDANDTIVRMARLYWRLCDMPEKNIIISRRSAYHGSTIAAASLGGMPRMHEQMGGRINDIVHIPSPYWFREGNGGDIEAFGEQCAMALEAEILRVGQNRVAAFIAEPVQGAGGVIIPPENYWPMIQKICKQYEVLLIADEVICGFGRLGARFGCDHYQLSPDFITCAKGLTNGYLPMSAVIVDDEIAHVLAHQSGEFAHGYTYSAHPTCAAVALETLAIIEREDIIATVQNSTVPYFQRRWRELAAFDIIGETRGLGMVAAAEIVNTDGVPFRDIGNAGTICRDLAIDNALVMRAVGDTMIVAPPLIISPEEIDELIEKAKITIAQTTEAIANLDAQ